MIHESTHSIQRQYIGSTPHSIEVAIAAKRPLRYSFTAFADSFILLTAPFSKLWHTQSYIIISALKKQAIASLCGAITCLP